MQNITSLPQPSPKHATCAWCNQDFDTIVQLLDHVDDGHTDSVPSASHRQISEAA